MVDDPPGDPGKKESPAHGSQGVETEEITESGLAQSEVSDINVRGPGNEGEQRQAEQGQGRIQVEKAGCF